MSAGAIALTSTGHPRQDLISRPALTFGTIATFPPSYLRRALAFRRSSSGHEMTHRPSWNLPPYVGRLIPPLPPSAGLRNRRTALSSAPRLHIVRPTTASSVAAEPHLSNERRSSEAPPPGASSPHRLQPRSRTATITLNPAAAPVRQPRPDLKGDSTFSIRGDLIGPPASGKFAGLVQSWGR
jgi:hypothetical protein